MIDVTCPKCGKEFRDSYRPSINLSLGEPWTEEQIERAMSVLCPHCGTRTHVGGLVVGKDGTFHFDQSRKRRSKNGGAGQKESKKPKRGKKRGNSKKATDE